MFVRSPCDVDGIQYDGNCVSKHDFIVDSLSVHSSCLYRYHHHRCYVTVTVIIHIISFIRPACWNHSIRLTLLNTEHDFVVD